MNPEAPNPDVAAIAESSTKNVVDKLDELSLLLRVHALGPEQIFEFVSFD